MQQEIKINLKALSVNEAWKGRRYKTDKYRIFERCMLLMLPKEFKKDCSSIEIGLGVSNLGFDVDNALKPILDILQKKYKFNDNKITKLTISKIKVKKGHEYISIK